MKKIISTDHNRAISAIFTLPSFKEVFESGQSDQILTEIIKYRSVIGTRKGAKIKTALQKAYAHLTLNYRNEYVYKNIIVNRLLLEHQEWNDAGLINELRIGSSIADIVIVNGTNTVYEIKTELDSPYKLKKQIADYRRISPKIYLVTHHTLADKYAGMLKDESVGLIVLNSELGLETQIEANTDKSLLSNKMMMSTLRKEEYSAILKEYYGGVPDVSNILYYNACLQLGEQIEPISFHKLMLKQLRKRVSLQKKTMQSSNIPVELAHICICQNADRFQYENLNSFLNLSV